MLVYLPTAPVEIQNQAFEYANRLLSDPKQLELIPAQAPVHALLGNPIGRPSSYYGLRLMQENDEAVSGYATHDFASVRDGNVVGIMGYSTFNQNGKIIGYGPWFDRFGRDGGFTFERDILGIYQEVINNTHETLVSVFHGEYNQKRMDNSYREKSRTTGFDREVIGKYERKSMPLKTVRDTLSGKLVVTTSVVLKGRLGQ
ncbi:hypothetical protein V4F87_003298 [Vibrio parahaemolyticus]|nr:hypothetical protein [Vibrio parahaemolyticus]